MILKGKKIFVAGASGLLGGFLVRNLENEGASVLSPSHKELDLTRQKETEDWLLSQNPDMVFIAAGKVGGIYANAHYPADFSYINTSIALNIIHGSYKAKVRKLLFLGSSCTYPKYCEQPIKEEDYLRGKPEVTNLPYAVAKMAGIQMALSYRKQYGCDFIVAMPTNTYGPGDHIDLKDCHVIPALIQKMHKAKIDKKKQIEIWGTGNPTRDFIYVDDFAKACVYLMKNYSSAEIINVGSGREVSIKNLAILMKDIIKFEGNLFFNTSKPDGMPRKVLDSSKINSLGWSAKVNLRDGIEKTYNWILNEKNR